MKYQFINKIFVLLIKCCCLFFMFSSISFAASNKGYEYFLSFQPSVVAETGLGSVPQQTLFITSKTHVTGNIQLGVCCHYEYFELEPNEVYMFNVPKSYGQPPGGEVTKLMVAIETDAEITVVGLNNSSSSADAFLGLPLNTLGHEYYVMSYEGVNNEFPSHIAIVGVYGGEVTITPMIRLKGSSHSEPGTPIVVDIPWKRAYYLSASDIEGIPGDADLTGTHIVASAPVAVFGGAVCANIPADVPACDHLVEMMPPVATWGTSFLTVPLGNRVHGDFFRILASQDQTEIAINGIQVGTINSGENYETVLTESSVISTSAPALVAQFAAGNVFEESNNRVGDPLMTIIPPAEQFLSEYSFFSFRLSTGFDFNYQRNFINVIVPNEATSSVALDGSSVDSSEFSPIGSSGYSEATISLSARFQLHHIESSEPFGLQVYGFNSSTSYGYPGGMNFDFINTNGDQYPPNIKLMATGSEIQGFAGDSEDLNINNLLDIGEDLNANAVIDRRTEDINNNGILDEGEDTNGDGILDRDYGIYTIELEEGSENLELSVRYYVPGTLTVQFTITVIDSSLPSSGTLIVTDGVGNVAKKVLEFSDEMVLQNVRVISTLSTSDIDLDETSFNKAPDSIDVLEDKTFFEWRFSSIAINQIENLSYDIVLKNPVVNESRLVTHKLELYYDDVNGNPVYQALGEQRIDVLPSIFTINIATDRQDYTAEQVVSIDTQLSNLSQFNTVSSIELNIVDSNGILVAPLGIFSSVALAASETSTLDLTQFNTGATYIGTYSVQAILRDENNAIVTQTEASFNIVAPTEMLYAARVSTDKSDYAANEILSIQNRVSNPAPNAILADTTAITRILAPDGSEFWYEEKTIPNISVQAFFDFSYDVPLGTTQSGDYLVSLFLLDGEGDERALSERIITVSSTQETGIGLVAQIGVTPSPVLKTEKATFGITLTNNGNSVVSGLPLVVSILDINSQQVLQQWDLGVIMLAMEQTQSFQPEWLANVQVGNHYAIAVNTIINSEQKVLVSEPLAVAEKLQTSLRSTGKGRLLVLLDETETAGASCQDLNQIDVLFRPESILLPDDQLNVELYDMQGGLLDSEALAMGGFENSVNDNTGAISDITLKDATADHISISLQSVVFGQAIADVAHRLVITYSQNGSSSLHDSGLFNTGCGNIEVGQVLPGDMEVVAIQGIDEEDPYGPDGSPSKITQRRVLESLLQEAGWSYTIVKSSEDFSKELNSGGYVVAALFNEQSKLSEVVQEDLVLAVEQGLGLFYAGYHDKRNGRIEPALGIKVSGKLPSVTGVHLYESVLQGIPASEDFNINVQPLSVDLTGAESVADFQSGETINEPAITHYLYGEGRSVYMGFDILLQAATTEDLGIYSNLITQTLDYIHPGTLAATAGRVLPITLSLENIGSEVSGQVLLSLPADINVIDPGLARLQEDGTLLFPFTVDTEEIQAWIFWLQLPGTAGLIQLFGDIDIATDSGQLIDYGDVQLDFDVTSE